METVIAPTWPLVDKARLGGRRGPVMILAFGQAPPENPVPPVEGVAVGIGAVSEAMKRVDRGLIQESIDGGDLVEPVPPLVLSAATLARVMAAAVDDPVDVLEVVAQLGERITVLPESS